MTGTGVRPAFRAPAASGFSKQNADINSGYADPKVRFEIQAKGFFVESDLVLRLFVVEHGLHACETLLQRVVI